MPPHSFLRLWTLAVLFVVSFHAHAAYFEVKPDVTEWSASICATGNIGTNTYCATWGGSWNGGECIGADKAAYDALPVIEQVRLLDYYRYGTCDIPSVTFSEWGQPSHSPLCWTKVTDSTLGEIDWSTSNLQATGLRGANCDTPGSTNYSGLRTRTVSCPVGTSARDEGDGVLCYKLCPDNEILLVDNQCGPPPEKDPPCPEDLYTNHPCNVATGNKFRAETDFATGALGFTRYYNSSFLEDGDFGVGWRASYQRQIIALSTDSVLLASANGSGERWTKVNGVWQGDADTRVSLTEINDGYRVAYPRGGHDEYTATGRLVSHTDKNDQQTLFGYDNANKLVSITNQYGHTLTLSYNDGRLASVTDDANASTQYSYDDDDNLSLVVYPDLTPLDSLDNPKKTYHYEDINNFPHHLTGITDENGDRYATFSYQPDGRVITSELATTSNFVGQEKISISYGQNNVNTVTDAAGNHVDWAFETVLGSSKLLSRMHQFDAKGITQTFDANGNLLSRTDAEGRVTQYTYNASNQKTAMTEAFGTAQARTTTYEYQSPDIDLVTMVTTPSVAQGNQKTVTTSYTPELNVEAMTINGFDAQGLPVTRATNFEYDAYGKVIEIDGPRTDVDDITELSYYQCDTGAECGQLAQVTNSLGHVTSYDAYDDASRLQQSTDANGVVTTYTYHPRGWVLSTTQTPPQGGARTTTYAYDDVGQLTTVTAPDGAQQHYVYDASHALREISDTVGNTITYTYDAKGNRTDELIFDPDDTLVRSTTTTYDTRNFIDSINAGGSVTQMVNNAVGNVTAQTDPNNNPSTTHNYDALDRLTSSIDALTHNTGYTYNVADQLIQVVAPNGATTQYEYDDLGNQTKEISPDRGTRIYTHDAAGNVISQTDARNITTDYGYDALNRLIAVDYPGADEDVTYTYDAPVDQDDSCGAGLGRLCTVTDQVGSHQFQYDAFGNVVLVEHDVLGQIFTWQYAYDDSNRLLDTMYPNGRMVSITRDAIGRLTDMTTTVNAQVTAVISNRTYRGDGVLREQVLGNGLWDSREHDLQGRLAEQTNAGTLPKLLSYDDNGNILAIEDDAGTRSFNYDPVDRLTVAGIPGINLEYGYDANGNRTSLTENNTATPLSYTANSNRLISNDSNAVTLDAAGNTLSDQAGNRVFEYNQAGRLDRVLLAGIEVAHYEYDSNGLRIKKVTPQDTRVFLYGLDGTLRVESDAAGMAQKEYLYADGELAAIIVREEGSPIIATPQSVVVEATDVLTPFELTAPNAVDVEGTPINATPDNIGPYPLGETMIRWTATDDQARASNANQLLTVVDTTAPVLTLPSDISVESMFPLIVDTGDASATDIFEVSITSNAPDYFQIGITPVAWTAVDINGNVTIANQTITVNEVSEQCPMPANVAAQGTASQSTTYVSAQTGTTATKASNAINGILNDMTATSLSDDEATWVLDFSEAKQIEQLVLHNRVDQSQAMLRDLIISVEDDQGVQVYQSALLNPENALGSPDQITVDLPPAIIGTKLTLRRVADPDLSGGGNSVASGQMLSFAEMIVMGCNELVAPSAPVLTAPSNPSTYADTPVSLQVMGDDANDDALSYSANGLPAGLSIDAITGLITGSTLAIGSHPVTVSASDGTYVGFVAFDITVAALSGQCPMPSNVATQGTASQSTTYVSAQTGTTATKASNAINGILNDMTATSLSDDEATWVLDFSEAKQIEQLVLHNRVDQSQAMLRDLIISVEDDQGVQVYQSALLNPENALGSPDQITVDLPPAIIGTKLTLRRVADPDLSGGGETVASGQMLSFAEMIAMGCNEQGGQ